ncbi:MAG TPA: hypothetical protein DCZ01_08100 [Elusimicrobia bacterium]|nr:MAG: hypothetical protein A2X37_09415 [Elusimicrobia bacterium GWA2_66_18]HAZ08466.1 hypothetical protein [Elusimicrobiota bacterium]
MTAAVFLGILTLYLGTLYPSIAPRDSADMAAAALTLTAAHPPGYPLYAILGRAWLEIFPFGDPSYRLNLLSALAGAGAAAALFALVRRRAGVLGGLAAAAVFALSAPLWKFSLLSEKYSLHALFAAALLLLAEGTRQHIFARARLTGLLLGLGLVNHQTLIFWLPGVLWLWRREASRQEVSTSRLAAAASPGLGAGLALNMFLWIRLGGLRPAWDTMIRARYGSAVLFAGMAEPLTLDSAFALLCHAARGLADAVSWPAAAAALVGAALVWREDRSRAAGWLLCAACAGPLFILLSRFDPSNWVARSVLEPAFLLPSLVAAAFAGAAVGVLSRRCLPAGALAAAGLAATALVLRAPLPDHRDDFLAYDYALDLRRAVPPGGALLANGDTASFALRWLDLVRPEARARQVAPAGLSDARSWLAAGAGRADLFTTGIGPAALLSAGLPSTARPLSPEGLVQHVGARPPTDPPLSVLRRPRAWDRDESYARDAKLSYAFAAWAAARLLEAQGRRPPQSLDLTAVSLDGEDYQLE